MSSYEHIGPDWDEEDEQSHGQHELKQRWGLICIKEFTGCILRCIRVLCSRKFLKALLYGQLVSLLLSGTAVFSGLLQQQGVNTPAGQNFLNYCLLCLVYTVMLACRPGDERRRTLGTMLRYDGWKYALLALVDFEANYLVVKAYQFTTITSVQLLNCLTILVVVVLSRIFLKTRYTAVHMAGIVISVVGLGGLVLADLLSGRNTDDPGGSKKWLGDVLVVCGAILYGMSNVGQEFVVKKFPRSDFLGMISLFGSFISGLQFVLLEKDEFATVTLSYKIWLPWLSFVLCVFLLYNCMSLTIQKTSATTLNLSMLSASFYSLLFGLFMFHYQFHVLYIVAFVLVISGILVYTSKSQEEETSPTDQDSTSTKVVISQTNFEELR